MVLPDRIELSTSPLPRECSTTELRQQTGHRGNRPEGRDQARAVLATRSPQVQARRQGVGAKNGPTARQIGENPHHDAQKRGFGLDPGPRPSGCRAMSGGDMPAGTSPSGQETRAAAEHSCGGACIPGSSLTLP